jgi:hypothetical protein
MEGTKREKKVNENKVKTRIEVNETNETLETQRRNQSPNEETLLTTAPTPLPPYPTTPMYDY